MIKKLNFENLIVLCVCMLFIILPQINISGYIKPAMTPKSIFFLYGIILLFVCYVLMLLFSKNYILSFSRLDAALFFLAVYISVNRYCIHSYSCFSIRYAELIGLVFLYAVIRKLSFKNYPWLFLAVIVSGMYQALLGILQLLGYLSSNHPGFKVTGSFSNPGPYSGFLLGIWSAAMGVYLFKDSLISQLELLDDGSEAVKKIVYFVFEWIPLTALAAVTLVLPAAESRASWLGAAASCVFLVEARYCIVKRYLKNFKAVKKTVLTILLIITALLIFKGLYSFKKDSSQGRLLIWKITAGMIAANPVFGVGFDQFKAEYMNYQADYFASKGETSEALLADNTYYAFNEWLQFLAENGAAGFLLLAAVLYAFFSVKAAKNHLHAYYTASACIGAAAVFAVFSYPLQTIPIKAAAVLMLSILSSIDADTIEFKIKEEISGVDIRWARFVVLLLAAAAGSLSFSYVKKLDQGFLRWGNAFTEHQFGDYRKAVIGYQSVYGLFKNDGDFLMNYGKSLSLAGNHNKAAAVLNRARYFLNNTVIETSLGDSYKQAKQYNKAEKAYTHAVNMIPSKFYASYLLVKFYEDSGQADKALVLAKKLEKKKAKVPSTAVEEIRTAMRKLIVKYEKKDLLKN